MSARRRYSGNWEQARRKGGYPEVVRLLGREVRFEHFVQAFQDALTIRALNREKIDHAAAQIGKTEDRRPEPECDEQKIRQRPGE
jgi:hypothetical protein